MPVTSQARTGTFVADPFHSSFQFAITHMGVGTFRAGFDDIEARAVVDDDGFSLEGDIHVKSLTIRNPPEFREHVLNGADFFDAANHPEITFCSQEVDVAEDGTFAGRGELTIKGITRPFDATGTYGPLVADPFGGTRTAVEIEATVDRREWGMDWQAPLPAGGDALGWDVTLSAHIELVRQP